MVILLVKTPLSPRKWPPCPVPQTGHNRLAAVSPEMGLRIQ